MICPSLAERTVAACLRALEGRELAEIRLDLMRIGVKGVGKIFSRPARLIATCRPGRKTEKERRQLLLAAVEAGAAFVDIELESPVMSRRMIVRCAREVGCQVIVSYHNFGRTPSRISLEKIIARAFAAGADIVKIACAARTPRDNARLLGLLDGEGPLIVVGMGAAGRITRIVAPFLGSVFTYAADEAHKTTAPGQMTDASLEQILGELKNETDR